MNSSVGLTITTATPEIFTLTEVGAKAVKTQEQIVLSMASERKVLSSAIYNGGFGHFNHFINIKVSEKSRGLEQPSDMIYQAWQRQRQNQQLATTETNQSLGDNCFGMMTAAAMNSLAIGRASAAGVHFTTLVYQRLGQRPPRW